MYLIFVYVLIPLLLLLLCARFRPELGWLLIPLCTVLDILLFQAEFAYYEARGLFALLSGIQAVIITAAVLPVFFCRIRPRFRSRMYLSLAALTTTLMVLLVSVSYQNHLRAGVLNSAPASVTLLFAIPFLPFLLVFLLLALHCGRKENHH